MESTERVYYQALFRRDFGRARELFRLLACSDYWPAERLQREGHKCGIYDEASYDDVSVDDVLEILTEFAVPELVAAG